MTLRYRSEQLSTVEFSTDGPPATKALNFADLQCPPSDVAQMIDLGAPYSPILAIGPLLYGWQNRERVSPVKSGCEVAAVRDPPIYARRVGKIPGPKDGNDRIA